MSCEKSSRKSGRAMESATASFTQAGSAAWAMTVEQAENQGFEDGYLGSKFDTSFKDRDPTSELAMVYEIGYLKGSEQAEVDAEMADRGEWPPLG
jgi:hypothetical protein